MLYTVGDLHGNQAVWKELVEPVLKAGDVLIVTGDFGVGFWNGPYWSEETFYDHIAGQSYTVLFVDGNHENFDRLDACPAEQWNGGWVHKLRHNLIHLIRGEVYSIEGITLFAFGGGHSRDRLRRVEHESWWARELPSAAEYENGWRNLQRAGNRVDCIITHTAPADSVQYLVSMGRGGILPAQEEAELTGYLENIRCTAAYERWYFGHFHVDAELWRRQTAQYTTVRELLSGRIVRELQPMRG